MKITDPQVIQNGEKNLIAAVQKNLDLETVRLILKDRIADTSFISKGGQIVVHDNQIAFRLDFDLNLSGCLLFDRQGNYIPDPSESSPAEDSDISKGAKFTTLSDGMGDTNFHLQGDMDKPFSNNPADEDDLGLLSDDEADDLGLLSDDDAKDIELLPDDDLDGLELQSDDAGVEDLTDDDSTDTDWLDEDQADLDDTADDNGLDPDDMIDDDIDDILKESRDFWEQKKGL
jgi:hypothetical protein